MSIDDTKTAFFQAPQPEGESDDPRILVVGGPLAGRVFCLTDDSMSIGRREGNDIILRTAAVSKHHATLRKAAHCQYQITDEGSRNGILLNDLRLSPHETADLANGDTINMAEHVLFFSVPCGRSTGVDLSDFGIDRKAVALEVESLGELLNELSSYRRGK